MGSAIATVAGLRETYAKKKGQRRLLQDTGRGSVCGPFFARDPNFSVTDVTRSELLKGNILVTYVTLVP